MRVQRKTQHTKNYCSFKLEPGNRLTGGGSFRNDVSNPIDDDGVEIKPPAHEEIKVEIIRFKNNKAAGLYGQKYRVGRTHEPTYLQNMAREKCNVCA